ncbi:hypothetical protein OUZ56_015362 [Daphnia magna]|uniref:Uncharacterized protein n=1 Tax=Daphnia magna TaxID=35525 RepID=A0ABR0AML8_9CRUS|nr:hypothetical protein OUZ56_015362 [Daphnia magna]
MYASATVYYRSSSVYSTLEECSLVFCVCLFGELHGENGCRLANLSGNEQQLTATRSVGDKSVSSIRLVHLKKQENSRRDRVGFQCLVI